MKQATLISLSFVITLYSCGLLQQNSNEKYHKDKVIKTSLKSEWTKLNCDLYINLDNDFAFATDPEIAFIHKDELETERCPNVFITEFGTYDDSTKLKEVIDTTTFESLGANMFKDKNHLYSYYAMCDGGYFNIFSDETAVFSFLGGSYFQFKSKNIIYQNRNIENVQLNLFHEHQRGCFQEIKLIIDSST